MQALPAWEVQAARELCCRLLLCCRWDFGVSPPTNSSGFMPKPLSFDNLGTGVRKETLKQRRPKGTPNPNTQPCPAHLGELRHVRHSCHVAIAGILELQLDADLQAGVRTDQHSRVPTPCEDGTHLQTLRGHVLEFLFPTPTDTPTTYHMPQFKRRVPCFLKPFQTLVDHSQSPYLAVPSHQLQVSAGSLQAQQLLQVGGAVPGAQRT